MGIESLAADTVRSGGIIDELDRLEVACTGLLAVIAELEAKLDPVLTNTPANSEVRGTPLPDSPVANRVHSVARQVNEAVDQLRDLHRRTDL